MAHYLKNKTQKEEHLPTLAPTNGHGKTGIRPSSDLSNENGLLSKLEMEIKDGKEHVIITNQDGEILFANPSVQAGNNGQIHDELIIDEIKPGKLSIPSSFYIQQYHNKT
jgi:hypothetical protein